MTYKPSELGVRTNNTRRPHDREEEGINFGVALSVLQALLFLLKHKERLKNEGLTRYLSFYPHITKK